MQTMWGKYLQRHPPSESEVHELKFTRTGRLSFDAVKEHQISALLEASETFLYHKITDQTWGTNPKHRFTFKKPFDSFCVVGVKAYVVMWFYIPRTKKKFIKMTIKKFLELQRTLPRKSLTEKIAKEYGEVIPIECKEWRKL